MPNLTPNYSLKKPIKATENADIDVINENMDTIDTKLKEVETTSTSNSTSIQNLNNNKVDKITGKSLSTNDFSNNYKAKLDGIEANANKYIHPANHPASIILEDSNHNFVTQTEKNKIASIQSDINASVNTLKSEITSDIGNINDVSLPAELKGKSLTDQTKELFQFANSGKQNWVDVVGSPLVTTDSFSTLKSKTQTLKNTLATNLTAKEQPSQGTESLSSLINKVANIETGYKHLSGTLSVTTYNQGAIFKFTSLNFRPKVVFGFIYIEGYSNVTSFYMYSDPEFHIPIVTNTNIGYWIELNENTGKSVTFFRENVNHYISNNGFRIQPSLQATAGKTAVMLWNAFG